MSRLQYDRTWWGAQWLQAQAQIDHDNRLPRRPAPMPIAVRYATLPCGAACIRAHVQGSRPRPYDADIEVPPIAAADATRLTQGPDCEVAGRLWRTKRALAHGENPGGAAGTVQLVVEKAQRWVSAFKP